VNELNPLWKTGRKEKVKEKGTSQLENFNPLSVHKEIYPSICTLKEGVAKTLFTLHTTVYICSNSDFLFTLLFTA